jgi:hypothetical protein
MNRPDALRAVLNIWEKRNFIPKGCNTIQYVGKQEYFHLLYSDDIANQNSKINTLIRRYKNEGGTGIGFMNTFDTLRKYNASLSIEEFNEPIIDNYTKVIAINLIKRKK